MQWEGSIDAKNEALFLRVHDLLHCSCQWQTSPSGSCMWLLWCQMSVVSWQWRKHTAGLFWRTQRISAERIINQLLVSGHSLSLSTSNINHIKHRFTLTISSAWVEDDEVDVFDLSWTSKMLYIAQIYVTHSRELCCTTPAGKDRKLQMCAAVTQTLMKHRRQTSLSVCLLVR